MTHLFCLFRFSRILNVHLPNTFFPFTINFISISWKKYHIIMPFDQIYIIRYIYIYIYIYIYMYVCSQGHGWIFDNFMCSGGLGRERNLYPKLMRWDEFTWQFSEVPHSVVKLSFSIICKGSFSFTSTIFYPDKQFSPSPTWDTLSNCIFLIIS